MFDFTEPNLSSTLLLTFAAISLYPAVTVIYNLCFHPLRKFPGPILWRSSRLPYIISLVRGNLVLDQMKIHEKYGDVVRLAPNEISFTKEEAWNDIYVHRPGHADPTKYPVWYKAPDEMPQNIVTSLDMEGHARFRKALSTSFTETSLRNQSPLIESFADLLINRLNDLVLRTISQENSTSVDIFKWVSWFTVDVVGELAFGESFGCLANSELHPWANTLNNFLKGMVYAAATRWYPLIERMVFRLLPKSMMDMQRKHSEFANDRINKRLKLEKQKPDFVASFMKENIDFQKISLKETQSNLAIHLMAGTDATATSISGTLLYLVQNPENLHKLVSEIRKTFHREADIKIATLRGLPYLNAVINEGLRLTNPVPGGLPRIVPPGGDTYANTFTSISVRPYAMSRSEKYFSYPNEFHPERWLSTGIRPYEFDNDHLSVSQPFSIGHSNYLGKNLAWVEIRLVIARLLWAFDVAETGKRLDWTKLKTLMIIQKEPIMLSIKIREGISELRKAK
ncbi:hypothetical protein BOTNAR_0408g00010 [Botryotinia narcissicola]|uniref:Cytochrome P450 monooxygenase n=1 Tax=Botryotinia narcissicola TaxID=278944 RepID=A0A4Z1HMI8_9HELO|nr:hypothetical protein BOTNAR_0408g00010 [Botryotinia narcissicola]